MCYIPENILPFSKYLLEKEDFFFKKGQFLHFSYDQLFCFYMVMSLLIMLFFVYIDYEARQMQSTVISEFLHYKKAEILKHIFTCLNIYKWDLLQTNGYGRDLTV